jgi:glycosyltransferase involved in cell wall biosynthesis
MKIKDLKKPYFSVVIPTLDEELRLPLLLKDLSLQSWTDFEVIHVDGGSKDKTLEKAKQWESKLDLRTISHDVKNVSSQRNRGASEAKGEWIIFMDADDRLPSFFLVGIKYRIERAESEPKKKFDVFSTLMSLNGEDRREPKNHTAINLMNIFFRATSKTNKPMVSGSMIGIRRKVFEKIHFDEKIKMGEDGNFVKDCVKSGWKYTILANPTYAFSLRRVKSNGMMKTATKTFMMSLGYLIGIDPTKNDYGYEMQGGSAYDKEKRTVDKR